MQTPESHQETETHTTYNQIQILYHQNAPIQENVKLMKKILICCIKYQKDWLN